MSLPCFFSTAGTEAAPLPTRSACSFSPGLCWTGLTGVARGRSYGLFLLFQSYSGGHVPFPGAFSSQPVFTSTLIYTFGTALTVWHHAKWWRRTRRRRSRAERVETAATKELGSGGMNAV